MVSNLYLNVEFPFKEVVKFALKDEQTVGRALAEFLGGATPSREEGEEIFSLFTEWLIFNFCTQRTLSLLNEYILVNPDNLDSQTLSEFREIAESHWYGGFEILKIKRGEFLQLEHLFSGRKIKVFDRLGSKNAPAEGTILCRVAKVGGQYYMVGSNPLFLPLTHTQRMKKIMGERQPDFCSSPREALQLFQENWTDRKAPHKGPHGLSSFDRDAWSGDEPKDQEEFKPFDDCPICQAMKRAQESGENLSPVDLRKAFQEAKEGGALVGGELPDDPNISLADFHHIVGKIGRNDPCPCGSGKKYKKCHGA